MKNSKTDTINIIGAPDSHGPIITFKNLKETDNGHMNLATENESQVKKSNSEIEDIEGSDFETAITATEYGKFNWLLLILSAWAFASCMNAVSTMSYILPSAECDLSLSNFDKGLLNSVTFLGMTVSAFFWGLLSDALGRKKVLVLLFALDVFFSTLVGLAQNFTFLLIAKLFTGFISSGPLAVLMSYLAENHSTIYRGSTTVSTGVFTSLANTVLPLLAWLIIPHEILIVLFNGYISLTSWRIFLLVNIIPSIATLIVLLFLDESPKFLMFQGNNEEALRVMRKIYKMNTGKPKDTFPIKRLKNEMGNYQKDLSSGSLKQVVSISWKQVVKIFHRPHILRALYPCSIQFFTLLGVHTVRLWSPQLFALAIENEKYGYNSTMSSTVCELLGAAPGAESVDNGFHCNANPVEDKVYFNSMITGTVTGICCFISAYVVKFWEKKWLMTLAYLLSITCCFGLYWSNTSNILLGVISLFIASTSVSATIMNSVVVDVFPTPLRTTAVCLCMTFGRIGAMAGNMAFPRLLDLNCMAPFILLAVVTLAAGSLTVLLPNTKKKALE